MQHDRQLCNANKREEQRDEQSIIGGYLHILSITEVAGWRPLLRIDTGLPKPMINTAECFESQSMT